MQFGAGVCCGEWPGDHPTPGVQANLSDTFPFDMMGSADAFAFIQ